MTKPIPMASAEHSVEKRCKEPDPGFQMIDAGIAMEFSGQNQRMRARTATVRRVSTAAMPMMMTNAIGLELSEMSTFMP